jgi:hypothetical protein
VVAGHTRREEGAAATASEPRLVGRRLREGRRHGADEAAIGPTAAEDQE